MCGCVTEARSGISLPVVRMGTGISLVVRTLVGLRRGSGVLLLVVRVGAGISSVVRTLVGRWSWVRGGW